MRHRSWIRTLSIVGLLSLRSLWPSSDLAAANSGEAELQSAQPQAARLLVGVTSGDLRTAFSKQGMQCEGPKRQATRVAWTCTHTEGSTDYRVEFVGTSPTKIEYLTGTILQTAPNPSRALEFLAFVASAPYTGSDPATAQAWVRKQGTRDGEKIIGNVIVRRSGSARALSVSLIPVGSDWQ